MNRFFAFFLILYVLIFVAGQVVSAKTWVEDFSDNNLDSWKKVEDHFAGGIWAPKTF